MRALAAAFALCASAAAADSVCREAWLARNLILDRAGACFASPLGQRYFDNAGCTQTPLLPEADAQRVAILREVEASYGCALDTSQPMADAPEWLFAFDPVPTTDGLESACIGWQGAGALLRSGPGGRITGELRQGDTIGLLHDGTEQMQFLTISRNGHVIARGWHMGPLSLDQCDAFAG
ncbi:MAG: DUF4453 domain-containing protein [Pseudomonadota bacterium]